MLDIFVRLAHLYFQDTRDNFRKSIISNVVVIYCKGFWFSDFMHNRGQQHQKILEIDIISQNALLGKGNIEVISSL